MKYVSAIGGEFRQRVRQVKVSSISRILGPHVCCVVTRTDLGYFAVDLSDSEVGGSLRVHGNFGSDQLDNIRPFVDGRSRVLVVGAHVGTLAIPLANSCGEVTAIEANPETFELLRMNIALNSSHNCRAIQIAASDNDEPIRFLLNTDNSGGSKRVPAVKKRYYYDDHPVEMSVPAARLDDLLGSDQFDVVVMDIEGSEYFALKGMQRILSTAKALVVEFLPHHLRNVSGVDVEEFLVPIADHFSVLAVPSTGTVVQRENFLDCLRQMYEAGQGDDGIIFSQ